MHWGRRKIFHWALSSCLPDVTSYGWRQVEYCTNKWGNGNYKTESGRKCLKDPTQDCYSNFKDCCHSVMNQCRRDSDRIMNMYGRIQLWNCTESDLEANLC